jgi:hypothetical protein
MKEEDLEDLFEKYYEEGPSNLKKGELKFLLKEFKNCRKSGLKMLDLPLTEDEYHFWSDEVSDSIKEIYRIDNYLKNN